MKPELELEGEGEVAVVLGFELEPPIRVAKSEA
jgi:hypothetical protein